MLSIERNCGQDRRDLSRHAAYSDASNAVARGIRVGRKGLPRGNPYEAITDEARASVSGYAEGKGEPFKPLKGRRAMPQAKDASDQVFRIIAALDGHFGAPMPITAWQLLEQGWWPGFMPKNGEHER